MGDWACAKVATCTDNCLLTSKNAPAARLFPAPAAVSSRPRSPDSGRLRARPVLVQAGCGSGWSSCRPLRRYRVGLNAAPSTRRLLPFFPPISRVGANALLCHWCLHHRSVNALPSPSGHVQNRRTLQDLTFTKPQTVTSDTFDFCHLFPHTDIPRRKSLSFIHG